MADSPIRVYLLDDHDVVRQGLRFLLERTDDIEVVGESASAVEADGADPGAAPRRRGARRPAARRLGHRGVPRGPRRRPTINALILTSYDDDEALFAAIMAGAAGYVLKEIQGSPTWSARSATWRPATR